MREEYQPPVLFEKLPGAEPKPQEQLFPKWKRFSNKVLSSAKRLWKTLVRYDAFLEYEVSMAEKRMQERYSRITMRGCQDGALRVTTLQDEEFLDNMPRMKSVPAHMSAHVWNHYLTNKVAFHEAVKTILDVYKESQNITTVSHIDAQRIANHIYMRILVREGLMSEAEYEEWEGLR